MSEFFARLGALCAIAAVTGVAATASHADPTSFPQDRTIVLTYTGSITEEKRTDLKSGQTRYDRSSYPGWEHKKRVFRVGNTLVVSLPDHQPGTVFVGGKEVIKAGHKAGFGTFECSEIIHEGGYRDRTCGRLVTANGAFRLETSGDGSGTGTGTHSVSFVLTPTGCEITEATGRSTEYEDAENFGMFPLPENVKRVTRNQDFSLLQGNCTVEAGRKPF